VLASQDVGTTGGRNEDLTARSGLGHGDNLVARDGGLKSVDGVDLSDQDTSTHGTEGHGTALSDVTETSDDGSLSGNHNIGGTLDTVDQRLTASVQVVELGLGDGVVDVDGRYEELALLEHLVQVVDTSGGLLGDTVAVLEKLGVLVVDKGGKITTVVEDKVQLLAVLESVELLLQAPVVLLLGLSLPSEAKDISARRRPREVQTTYTGIPAAAIAAAAWSWVEKMLHEVQVHSAPRATRVSIRTAVWMAASC
jgi:hypothetical protein